MKIQTVDITKINPAQYNPRKDLQPGDLEYEKLKKSILAFDMVEPLVWNEQTGNLVGGHQRLKVLKELGRTEVEVSVVNLDEVKEKALNLALNKISGEWDFPKLKEILEQLDTGAFDIEITGFDSKEIEDLMTQWHVPEEGLTDDDAIPEQVETVCKTGQLWQLGSHYLLCGDCTQKANVERLMQGQKAELLVTSPPYWIGKDYEREKTNEDIELFIYLVTENVTKFIEINGRIVINVAASRRHLATGGNIETRLNLDQWINHLKTSNWLMRYVRCWAKSGSLWGDSPKSDMIDQNWEFIATFYNPNGNKKGQNRVGEPWAMQGVWDDLPRTKQEIHSAPFCVELPSRIIKLYSDVDEKILEPFAGSGTTAIACEKLGRKCYMMEIDPHYCDVIRERWMAFTGKQAVLLDKSPV